MNIETAFPDAMAAYLAGGAKIQQLPGFVAVAPLPQRIAPLPRQVRKASQPTRASLAREAADLAMLPRVIALAALGIPASIAAQRLKIGRPRLDRIAAKHHVIFKGSRP